METRTCPNCATSFEGSFCPHCGQRFLTIPFTFKFLTKSAIELLDFNRGFLVTLYFGIVRPKELIHTYLRGSTRRFNNPIRFLIALTTLLVLLDYIRTSGNEGIQALYVVPIVGAFSIVTSVFNYILFRSNWGFIEHIIIAVYFTSLSCLIVTLPVVVFFILESKEIVGYNDTLNASIQVSATLFFAFRFNIQVFLGSTFGKFMKTLLYLLTLLSPVLLAALVKKLLAS